MYLVAWHWRDKLAMDIHSDSIFNVTLTPFITVNHVVAALSQMGKVTTNEKHYKNRVSGVIRTLTDDGVLERTHKGGGNDPHKYREQEESPQMALVNNEG